MSRKTGAGDVLDRRALNRAALARQMLLERHAVPVVEAVERVGGLNAQSPNPPYVSLWTRLAGFRQGDLTAALEDGRVVRSTLHRSTQHIVARDDFPWLRAALTPLLARAQRNVWAKRAAGAPPEDIVAAATEHLAGGGLTRPELGRRMAERWPDAEPTALGWSAQYLVPILHPAPSGTWDTLGVTPFVLASEQYAEHPVPPWEGERARREAAEEVVRRHLAAFGPALVSDVRAWSGVAGLKEVVAGMRDELRTFRDEKGRELLDLPDAPRPHPDVSAPVRFLPEFDELLLGYYDRTRVMTDEVRTRVCVGDLVSPTVLVDGTVRAMWELDRPGDRRKRAGKASRQGDDGTAVLTVRPFAPLSCADADAVTAEGARLVTFAVPGDTPADIRILPSTE